MDSFDKCFLRLFACWTCYFCTMFIYILQMFICYYTPTNKDWGYKGITSICLSVHPDFVYRHISVYKNAYITGMFCSDAGPDMILVLLFLIDRCSVYAGLINKYFYIGTLFISWFMQDFSLFRVWFRQVSLYFFLVYTIGKWLPKHCHFILDFKFFCIFRRTGKLHIICVNIFIKSDMDIWQCFDAPKQSLRQFMKEKNYKEYDHSKLEVYHQVLRQVALGLEYLQQRTLVHIDLCQDIIMVSSEL